MVLRARSLFRLASLLLVFSFRASAGQPDARAAGAVEPKRVLVIYQVDMNFPAIRALDSGIRSVFGHSLDIQLYSEHLDVPLFPDPEFQAAQLDWFRRKYRDRKIDLVIAAGLLPQTFLPGIPTVFCGLDPAGLSHTPLPVNSTAVWLSLDFKGTLTAAAGLQPKAHQIVVVNGTSAWDRHLESGLRNAPLPGRSDWAIDYWDDLPVEEIRSRLAKLPKDTIVLYISMQRDGAGRSYVSPDLIRVLSAASSAPIYGLSDGFIGFGIVGGSVISYEAQGVQLGEIGQRILQGEKPDHIPPLVAASSYIFDWRQLHRFDLSESALPPGSSVRFAVRSPWDLYKPWVIGGLALVLFQACLIGYLLAQRRRRRRAEETLAYEFRFESLLAGLSATFANISTERTNAEIEKALEKLRAFLKLDRVSLFETANGDGRFVLSYSASLAEIPPGPQSFSRDDFPWIVSTLLQGGDCVFRRPQDFPHDAQKEQEFFEERDYSFMTLVPLRADRLTVGGLAFISFREGSWPDTVIQRFRVVADVFANPFLHKRIVDGLQESQERFHTIADTAPVMIWTSGTNKFFTFFNKQWLDFRGRSLHQELGYGWSEGVHPDDLEQCLSTYLSSFEARRSFTAEFRLRRADGDYGWIFNTGVPRYTPAGEFTGYIGSCMDTTDWRRAEQVVLDLTGRLISAQEDERARIARELHDDFSQRLAVLSMQLEELSENSNSNTAAGERLHKMWQGIAELSSDIHRLSHQLHSSTLHHAGLLAAAKSLCHETGKQHRIQIDFVHQEMPEEISPEVALCLFRTLQEALNNIVKHSSASHAHVEFVGTSSRIRMRIVDAGVGFDPSSWGSQEGLGLLSMRERLRLVGGTIVLRSRPMEGTEIVAEVPLSRPTMEGPSHNLGAMRLKSKS
jgi:PAS domain S-box-containing protein